MQEKGKLFAIFPFYYAGYANYYDENGETKEQNFFNKTEFKPYFEYGYSDRSSIIFSPSFQYVTQTGANVKDSNSALVYSEVAFKSLVYQFSNSVISYKIQAEIPGFYDEEDTPFFGYKDFYVEAKALYGLNLPKLAQLNHFINIETGFRSKASGMFDKSSGGSFKLDFTYGFEESIFLKSFEETFVKINYTKSLSGYSQNFSNLNRHGYDLVKLELAFKTNIYSNNFEISYFTDIYGKNTGSGDGVMFALWKNF